MNTREQLKSLATALLEELSRDDWEGSTVREVVLEMQATLDAEGK